VNATIQLRDYQQDAHDAVIRQYLGGTRRTLIVLPTGAGKTIVFGSVIAKAAAQKCRSLVLAHTEELVDQAARTLRTLLPNVSVGIVRAHHNEPDAQVVVATVQTLRNPMRLARCGHFHQVVIDEAHHAVARTYQDILETLGAFDDASVFPFVLGVTATADRADGQGLGRVFESICYETGIFDLIQRGYLSDIRAKRIMLDVNLDRVQTRGGDFVDSALGEAMTDAGAPGHIAAAIRDHAPGRRTIVFTPTVAMAEQTAAAILIDNLTTALDSGSLAGALTTTWWSDRRLGVNEMIRVPVRCIWLATANNPTMSTEIARRTVRIRLDPKVDRPWQRTGFRHEDLRGWADEHRPAIVCAALTLVQSWVSAGQPLGKARLGSFEKWAAVHSGILDHLGVKGFLANANEFYEAADVEGAIWRQFVDLWFERFNETEVGVADLFGLAQSVEGFDFGQGSDRAQRITFGRQLGNQRDRVIGDCRVTQTRMVKRIKRWRIIKARPGGNPFDVFHEPEPGNEAGDDS
jgi:hypothetical protein